MENLNIKIINLLKEHKEGGEKFFDALDLMIRSDCSICNILINVIENYFCLNLLKARGVILSGKFGQAFYNNFKPFLTEQFKEVLITNGGIRGGERTLFRINFFKL